MAPGAVKKKDKKKKKEKKNKKDKEASKSPLVSQPETSCSPRGVGPSRSENSSELLARHCLILPGGFFFQLLAVVTSLSNSFSLLGERATRQG